MRLTYRLLKHFSQKLTPQASSQLFQSISKLNIKNLANTSLLDNYLSKQNSIQLVQILSQSPLQLQVMTQYLQKIQSIYINSDNVLNNQKDLKDLSNIKMFKSSYYQSQNLLKPSLEAAQQALNLLLLQQQPNLMELAHVYRTIGDIHLRTNEFLSAQKNLQQSKNILIQLEINIDTIYALANLYNSLAKMRFQEKRLQQTVEYVIKSFQYWKMLERKQQYPQYIEVIMNFIIVIRLILTQFKQQNINIMKEIIDLQLEEQIVFQLIKQLPYITRVDHRSWYLNVLDIYQVDYHKKNIVSIYTGQYRSKLRTLLSVTERQLKENDYHQLLLLLGINKIRLKQINEQAKDINQKQFYDDKDTMKSYVHRIVQKFSKQNSEKINVL